MHFSVEVSLKCHCHYAEALDVDFRRESLDNLLTQLMCKASTVILCPSGLLPESGII